MATKRSDAQRNQAHLVKTARKMMRSSGAIPSFNELAKRAGVGVGTVYRNFADPQALLAGLVKAQLYALQTMLEEATANPDAEAGLAQLFHGAVALQLESPALGQLMTSQSASDEVAAQVAGLEEAAEQVLVRARAAGCLRNEISAGDFRRLVCGIEYAARAGDDVDEAAARYVDIALRGVRPTETLKKKR